MGADAALVPRTVRRLAHFKAPICSICKDNVPEIKTQEKNRKSIQALEIDQAQILKITPDVV